MVAQFVLEFTKNTHCTHHHGADFMMRTRLVEVLDFYVSLASRVNIDHLLYHQLSLDCYYELATWDINQGKLE